MKIEVEKAEKNVAQINIEIEADHASQEYNKACRRLSQRLNIPGFRRGKAPRQVIEKTIGAERIKQEVLDRILPHAFADAISEHQLDVVAPPQIDNFKFDPGQPLSVKAHVELRPDVELPDLTTLKIEVPEFKSSADAMEAELEAIRERMTTLETVIDRPSNTTDIVNIDFTGAVNGELIRGGSAKNYQLDLGDNNFIEGFAEQVVGHKIGEEFTIKVKFPEDYHDKPLQGKDADFTIKINEIKQKVVPRLDDDLAKKIGPYESVDQLREEITNFIGKNAEMENTFRKQKAIIEKVVADAKMEVPDAMINREARILLEEVQHRFRAQGMNWDQFVDTQGHESIWENLREEALRRIRTSLTFSAIAKQENMTVTEDEFKAEVNSLAEERNLEEKQILRELANNPSATQALTDQILSEKIVSWLMERAEVIFVEETANNEAAQKEGAEVASTLEKETFDMLASE